MAGLVKHHEAKRHHEANRGPLQTPDDQHGETDSSAVVALNNSTSSQLFCAQRDHRIDARRATSRNEAGYRGDRGQYCPHRAVDPESVEHVHMKQKVLERGGADGSEQERGHTYPKEEPDPQLPRALGHDHAENSHRIRAERHANAEFLRPLVDRKTHDSVETDRRQ